MPKLELPLSGNVSQVINPWQWMFNLNGGQLGLINIDMGQSRDPELEKAILDDVGTYGRQIGQLADALAAVLLHLKDVKWPPESRKAIDAFEIQLAQVRRLKAQRRR